MIAVSGISFFAVLFITGLFFLAEHILFGLAAYHDALARENPDALLWGLAVGFLGFVPGIVYLCVRSSARRLVRCSSCGYLHDAFDFCCPKCGERNPSAAQENPEAQFLAARAKKELIGGIILFAAGIFFLILFAVFLSFFVIRCRIGF